MEPDSIARYEITWFKEEIIQIQEREENLFGESLLKINSDRILSTKDEEFSQWRMLEPTRTDRNCSFITYRFCRDLDQKHTVFGKIGGGLDTLNPIEKIEVYNEDKPIEDIEIQVTQVFVDPYEEADKQLAKERQAEIERLPRRKRKKHKFFPELSRILRRNYIETNNAVAQRCYLFSQ